MSRPSLSVTERGVLAASVVADLGLRTALASAISLPALGWAASGDARAEPERLRFYAELFERGQSASAFAPPPGGIDVRELPAPAGAFSPGDGGRVRTLRFEGGYVALNPALREPYAAHAENRIGWAQHWRHGDRPRPTVAVIHGFGASPYWFNSAFFSLPWLYRRGYDVLMYLLPFHGVRQARAAFSGWGLFAHGAAHFNEAIAHAVHDFRVLLDHLAGQGVDQVALTGLSLGGYVSALVASVDARIGVVIPNAPVVSMAPLIRSWFPASLAVRALTRVGGIADGELERALAFHCPLTHRPRVPHERRMIIGGLGDRLAPPEQTRMLWEHWDRPRLHWFPGNHVLHAGRGTYLHEMLAFMIEAGVGG